MSADFLQGDVRAITSRGLSEAVCQKYGYRVASHHGKMVQVADYRNGDGDLIAQKVRDQEKNFSVIGEGKNMPLFGQHLWGGDRRTRLVITEGEIDCLSVAQVFPGWPVVSVPNGAQSAAKAVARALEFVEAYESVVFMFDMDEPGRAAAVECAAILTPGRASIAELPLKDANAMLQEGRVKELTSAVYQARTYRPDGVVSSADIREKVLAVPVVGLPYAIDSLNKYTYGRRIGDVIGFGGGTGCGKTDLLVQMVDFDVNTLGIKTGVLFLEQDVGETGKRIAGKVAGKRFHVPDGSWSQEELEKTWARIEETNRLHLYDSFGSTAWSTIRSRILYMIEALGCTHIYLDHMTALVAGEEDERRALDSIMEQVAGLAKGRCVFHYVSHLTTPEKGSHEQGAPVEARHFRGSRALGFWSHCMWGIERNKQAASPEDRCRTILRCLKDRFTGDCDGRTFEMLYDRTTGRLQDRGEIVGGSAEHSNPFTEETPGGSDF